MATVAKNNIVRSVNPYSVFESAKALVTSAVSFNQGDLIIIDTTNHILATAGTNTDGGVFLGVATQTIVSGVVKGPYQGTAVDASVGISDIRGPVAGVIVNLKLKSGDAFVPGCDVYACSVDAQTVTSTAGVGGLSLGKFQDAAITAGATSTGNVYLKAYI